MSAFFSKGTPEMNSRINSRHTALHTTGRIFAATILIALSFALPKPARAGRLAADTIALFPKDIGEFAYADLKKARTLKWFPQLQEQMLPDRFRQFKKLLASAGAVPQSQVERLDG